MKWFKHLSGSLNNSLIFESIEKFGSDAYLVFFGTLELMSDEFDIYDPGIVELPIGKMMKNFQLSRGKVVRILRFFDEKSRKSHKKTVGFRVHLQGDIVVINCPRLKELCDEYTSKLLSKVSGQTPAQEAEAEAEAEADYKTASSKMEITTKNQTADIQRIQGCLLNKKIGIDDLICLNRLEVEVALKKISERLLDKKIFPGVKSFIGLMESEGFNQRSILHALIKAFHKKKFAKTAFAYSKRIVLAESGNYFERENLDKINDQFKAARHVKDLASGLFKNV